MNHKMRSFSHAFVHSSVRSFIPWFVGSCGHPADGPSSIATEKSGGSSGPSGAATSVTAAKKSGRSLGPSGAATSASAKQTVWRLCHQGTVGHSQAKPRGASVGARVACVRAWHACVHRARMRLQVNA